MRHVELSSLVLAEGRAASACGRVVKADDGTWFEPPLPVARPLFAPGHEPAPQRSGLGIRAEGVDLFRLGRRREKDGTVEGWAFLSGVWRDGTLTVTEQGLPPDDLRSPAMQAWTTPPGDPPPDGWPVGEVDADLGVGDDLQGPEVVAVTMFRPTSRQVVAVIASEDPDLTRRRLGAALDGRLCVVQSKWSADQVREVRAALDANHDAWLLYSWGASAGEDGQRQLTVKALRVTLGFAEFAAEVPDGLLAIEPWLKPVGA
jgi:hypothetical protein